MNTVSRVFETEAQAQAAYDALLADGYRKERMVLLAPEAAETEGAAAPDWRRAMAAGALLGENESFYAEQIAEGHSLVVVAPPFGEAVRALDIMAQFNPLGITAEPPREPFVPWTERPAMFSTWLGLGTIYRTHRPGSSKTDTTFSAWIGKPTLTRKGRPFSAVIGKPLLTKHGRPFSEAIGKPTLTKNGRPFSESIGKPTLTKKGRPFSEAIGKPTLTRKGRPFSEAIGKPLLTKRKHFLTAA